MTMRTSIAMCFVVVGAGCIDDVYVSGGPCSTSQDCPVVSEDPEDPVGTGPEQCVSTGAESVCVPLPFSRPETTCTDASQCQAAGFPVEAVCSGVCQCPAPVGTPPERCIWNPNSCACNGTPPPDGG